MDYLYCLVTNNEPILPTHIIKTNSELFELRAYIYCTGIYYAKNESELNHIRLILDENEAEYSIDNINWDLYLDKITKIKENNWKFPSRQDLVNYLIDNILPEGIRLEQEKKELEYKLSITEDALLELMFGGK